MTAGYMMTEEDHDLMDRYLDRILDSYKSEKINKIHALGSLAHAITLMQNEGPQSVIAYFSGELDALDSDD